MIGFWLRSMIERIALVRTNLERDLLEAIPPPATNRGWEIIGAGAHKPEWHFHAPDGLTQAAYSITLS